MAQQIPIDPAARADSPDDHFGPASLHALTDDLAYQRLAIVNVVYFGPLQARDWVLIDTGVAGSAPFIRRAVEARYGAAARPAAILLTHGHFDHVGSLKTLLEQWDVPVYAHELELPYLNGSASYPPPDPTVGGGMMSLLSPLYPRGPIDVSRWLKPLPTDRTVPFMPGWKWISVPGHSPGQVAFWREQDRSLIAADAFVTTAQESVYAAATQEPELHGPPMYYTQDWDSSRRSVQALARLEPEMAITGHGRPMQGPALRQALTELSERFDEVAVPQHGKYVQHPATPQDGSAYRQ